MEEAEKKRPPTPENTTVAIERSKMTVLINNTMEQADLA